MELAIFKQDWSGGYIYSKGDVLDIKPDNSVWNDYLVTGGTVVIVRAPILDTHKDALIFTKFFNPTRRREYSINIDSLVLSGFVTDFTRQQIIDATFIKP